MFRRWLRADLVDLVDVAGARGEEAGGTGSPGPSTFDGDLKLLRRRIVRRWALAVAARYALLALAVAVVPAPLAALGLIGWAWAVVVPAALFLVALGARLARPPSLGQVARLLDDRLELFDVTATALGVERSGAAVEEGPAAPVFAEAAALLRAGASAWRPRTRLGGRELAAAGGLVIVLAVLAVVGSSGGGNGSSEAPTALAKGPGAARRAGGGANSVSPPLTRPRAKRKADGRRSANPYSPYGIYDPGYEGKRSLPRYKQSRQAGLYSRGGAPQNQGAQQFASEAPGEANEAREKAEAEALKDGGAKPTPGSKREGTGKQPGQSLKSLTGGAAPPSGSVQPLPNANTGGKPPASQGAGGSPSSSNAPGARSDAESPSRQGGGRPSGSKTAGGQHASLANGTKGSEGGGTGGELSLKAGFAAIKSGKAASGRGPRNAQGAGGPGKSAGIGGAAFEEAEAGSLGYVPPDAGVAPTLDPGLFSRYLNALARIEGRRW